MIDRMYAKLLADLLDSGEPILTRNSRVRRLFAVQQRFETTPLISVRKTAWKTALREMEFFLSGGVHLDNLHPSVRPWWEPFCTKTPKSLLHSYGTSLRKLYCPDQSVVLNITPKESHNEAVEPVIYSENFLGAGNPGPLTGKVFSSNSGSSFKVLNVIKQRTRGNYIYRVQFDETGSVADYRSDVIQQGRVKDYYRVSLYGEGSFGEPDATHPLIARGKQNWHHMMQRCYDSSNDNYHNYGGRGVQVCERWRCFSVYLNDLAKLPGYAEWLLEPTQYHLDKDYYGAKVYGPDTCVFLPASWNTALSKSRGKFSVYKSNTLVREFLTAADMNRFFGLSKASSRGVERLGYQVVYTPNTESTLYRYKLMIDQVGDLIDGIKNHPYSRRHAITTWIPQHVQMGLVNPTNCHGTIIQTFVDTANALHLVTYQRSADVVCGLPHNLIQYWAFLMWLAHRAGRGVGSLTWIGGDVHLYDVHTGVAEAIVKAMLETDPVETPQLVYTPTTEEFRADDFTLDREYRPLLELRAEMVV